MAGLCFGPSPAPAGFPALEFAMPMTSAIAFALPLAGVAVQAEAEQAEVDPVESFSWQGPPGCDLPPAAELELRGLLENSRSRDVALRVVVESLPGNRVKARVLMSKTSAAEDFRVAELIPAGSCETVVSEAVEILAALMRNEPLSRGQQADRGGQKASSKPQQPPELPATLDPETEGNSGTAGYFGLVVDAGAQSGPFGVWSYGAAVGMQGYQGRAGLELRLRYTQGVESFRYEDLGQLGDDGLNFERRYHQAMVAPAFCISALAEPRIRAGFCFGVELGWVAAPVSSSWVGSEFGPSFWGAATASVRMTLLSRAYAGLGFGMDSWWTAQACCVDLRTNLGTAGRDGHFNGVAGIRVFFDLSFQLHHWRKSPKTRVKARARTAQRLVPQARRPA